MSIVNKIESISNHLTDAYNSLEGLGINLNGVNKNIENLSMILDDIYDSMPQVSEEGISLTLDNTRVGKIKSTLKGNISQDGTPTPSLPIPINVVSGRQDVVVAGKNLFNVENGTRSYGGQTYSIEDNIFKFSSTTVSGGISAGAITTYTSYSFDTSSSYVWSLNKKSGNWTKGSAYPRVLIYIKYSDDTTSYSQISLNTDNQQSASNTITFTSGKIPVSFAFGIYAPNGSLSNNVSAEYYVQLEKSSSATSYEPYQGNIYNIDLPEGMELCSSPDGTKRDYLLHDKTIDKWYWHREIGKVVLDGSEGTWRSWYNTENNNIGFYNYLNGAIAKDNSEDTINGKAYCNMFNEATNRVDITNGTEEKYKICGRGNEPSYIALSLSKDKLSDWSSTTNAIDSLKSWLANNNPIVYYILATPTITEITYQPLIDQLNLLEKAMSKDGQTNISQVNNDLPFIIKANALIKNSD